MVIVNFTKAIRLYIIIFGNKFSKREYFIQFIKTSIVNSLLPFKSGELYRGYCIGKIMKSYANGYIAILFDRFVDTLALMTVVVSMNLFMNVEITAVFGVLTVFLFFLMIVYWGFLPFYQYWNHFLIFYKNSSHTLIALLFLEKCKVAFENISYIVKGRFMILYLVSFLAWTLEIAGLYLLRNINDKIEIGNYLLDILMGKANINNFIYILLSLSVFLVSGFIIFFANRAQRKDIAIWKI